MTQIVYVRDIVGAVPYWAADETLPMARNRFKRLTGKFPTKDAKITAFEGASDEIDKITIDDMGTINYPKTVVKFNLQ